MTTLRLVALAAVNIAYLWFLDRRDGRDRTERASWLQRIQAPYAAMQEHHAAVMQPEPAASPLPLSDEEMAEMQAPGSNESVAAIIARMEAVENGHLQPEDGFLP